MVLAAALATAVAALVVMVVGGVRYNIRLQETGEQLQQSLDQSKGRVGPRITEQASDLKRRIGQLDSSLFTMQLNQAEASLN